MFKGSGKGYQGRVLENGEAMSGGKMQRKMKMSKSGQLST
jgi:hypothetical protein